MFSRPARICLWLTCVAHAALLYTFAALRYGNVHQRTYDLALYARLAWGYARLDFTTPVLDLPPLSIHLSPVLLPLGLPSWAYPEITVHVLLLAQAACVALCVFPVARIGARHMGKQGIFLAVAAWLLYPNLFHVSTYEFHPGTLAVLPMCWAFDALARGNLRHLAYACIGMLLCREDLFVMCVLFALLHYTQFHKRPALWLLFGCATYGVVAVLVIVKHAPANSSLDQHFAIWGGSPLGMVRTLFTEPQRVIAHLRAPERLYYLPRLLAALSFFPLRAPRLLIPALPYLALNLASAFPTTTQQYSHYLTPAVPALVVAGIVGVTRVQKRGLLLLWLLTLGIAHYATGGSPLSRDFDHKAFTADAQTGAAHRVLATLADARTAHSAKREAESVEAPDALLSHLAERRQLHRAPPPLHGAEYIVLDISHRQRFAKQEVLLRTSQEPFVREILANPQHTLLLYAPPYAVVRRGPDTRARDGIIANFFKRADDLRITQERPVTACLSVVDALLVQQTLRLFFRASGPCRADLALRLSENERHARADLLFDGALSPALLAAGDYAWSDHALSVALLSAARSGTIYLSSVRADGKTAEPGDPLAVAIQVRQSELP